MSSASSSSLPSAAELENLGILFVGFVIATVMYGLTFFQTYIYYSRYPRDSPWIRYLVAIASTLDTAASALVSEVLYYYLIILFDVNLDVLYATTTFCIQYILSVLLTFISRLFFVYRVFQVTGGSRVVTLVLIFLSFIALVFGLTSSGQMFAQRQLSAFGIHMEVTTAISLATGLMADVIVFATMCFSLRRTRYPELVVPDGFIPTVITLLIGRGLAFIIVQAAYFFVFMAVPSKPLWIPFQMVACKIYVNTLLAHLNSRDVRRGQGLNEEVSLTDRKPPVNAPQSIRLNVTDFKSTTQSVSFNTRQRDTESEGTGTELESGKTYHDELGNEYAQVSSGSTQSQTDHSEVDKGSFVGAA